MSTGIKQILAEVAEFMRPLNSALESTDSLSAFLARFGYGIDVSSLASALTELSPLKVATEVLVKQVGDDIAQGGVEQIDVDAVLALAQSSFTGFVSFRTAFATLQDLDGLPNKSANLALLSEDLFHSLLSSYLERRAPTAARLVDLLGISVSTVVHATNDPRSRGVRYRFLRHNWSRVARLIRDPRAWGGDVYGWGADFDSNMALFRLAGLLDAMGGLVQLERMSDVELQRFMPSATQSNDGTLKYVSPLVLETTDATLAEFGLALFPVDPGTATDRGLAIGPYSEGQLSASTTPFPGAELTVTSQAGSLGGVVFSLKPSGFTSELGVNQAAFEGELGVELEVGPANGNRLVFLGAADGTRLDAEKVSAKAGATISSASNFDVYLAGGIKDLQLVISPDDDGLLGAIISSPIVIEAGDIGLGWRPDQGIYFEGGSNLAVIIPLDRSIGPLTVHELTLELDFEINALNVTTSADLTIGPLFAAADSFGVSAALIDAPDNSGVFGDTDLAFGFIPPTGYAASLQSDVFSGGGLIAIGENEYRGALALSFQQIGFSAFAIPAQLAL